MLRVICKVRHCVGLGFGVWGHSSLYFFWLFLPIKETWKQSLVFFSCRGFCFGYIDCNPYSTLLQVGHQCTTPCCWSQTKPMAGGFPLTAMRAAVGLPCGPCASVSGSLTSASWTHWSRLALRVAEWLTTIPQATWEPLCLLFLHPMLWMASLPGNGEKDWWRCYQKLKSTLSSQATLWRRIFNTGKFIGVCSC